MADGGEVDFNDETFEAAEDDEEGLIHYYIFRGFEYEETRLLLLMKHGNEMG